MGQFGSTTRLATTPGVSALGPWVLMPTGATTVNLEFTNGTHDSGGNANVLSRLYWNASPTWTGGHTMVGSQDGPWSVGTNHISSWSTSGIPAGSYVGAFLGNNNEPNANSADCTYTDNFTYCEYGGQRRTDVPVIVQIAPQLVLSAIGYATNGLAWAIGLFLAGTALDLTDLCGSPRGPEVHFTVQDYADLLNVSGGTVQAAAAAKAIAWWKYMVWPYYCECAPGANPTTPEPYIVQPDPPGGPLPPATGFACDPDDLCDQVLQIRLELAAMRSRLESVMSLTTLIQRQDVPFGYIASTVHSALSGQGHFDVQGILGLAVTFTTLPSVYPAYAGDPATFHQLGSISVGTVDGWLRSWQPTHSPYMILPIAGAITKVGWRFADGIVATITELVREP